MQENNMTSPGGQDPKKYRGQCHCKFDRDAGEQCTKGEIRAKIQGIVNTGGIKARVKASVKVHGNNDQQKQTKWSLNLK